MRYIPNVVGGNIVRRFDAGPGRPPMELIPKPLAELIVERERIGAQRSAAEARANELMQEGQDATAARTDSDAATAAARAGKPIPEATAAKKLDEQRTKAQRELAAQVAAFQEIGGDCEAVADKLYWDGESAAAEARIKARKKIEALANQLADAVEAAVSETAAHDWLRESYYPQAATWPTDVIPELGNQFNITRQNTKPVPARQIILGAALAVLTDNPEGQ